MAIAIDSQMASNAGVGSNGTTPLTFSFNNAAGTLLLAGLIISCGASGVTSQNSGVSSAPTYDGTPLSLLSSYTFDLLGGFACSALLVYYLKTPATGNKTFSVACQWNTPPTSNNRNIAGLVSLTGAELVGTTFGTPVTNGVEGSGASSISTNVTGTTSGSLIMDLVGCGAALTAPVAGQTTTWLLNHTTNTASDNGAMSTKLSGGGTVSMGWTNTQDWIHHIVFEIFASSAAAASLPPYYNPMAALIGR